ncbi:hypothetical protein SCHPADRAFT_828923 [Schizopora paradoxa]|uniref:Uncharacterized protein n=1 Tax=Schizopora paradoxa TaxID=27342 RepID=A0A0H2RMJ8_9AGAM|nr:hypothetical protein SCHPADRAFT_828923 [Schizopora paradoxa]
MDVVENHQAGGANTGHGGSSHFAPQKAAMPYSCADCGASNSIRAREPIRCRECGHRIMYKPRTRRSALPFCNLTFAPACISY